MGMVYLIYMNDHEWLIVIGCYWYIPYIHGSVMGPHSIPRFCARNCGTTNIAQQWCGTGWWVTRRVVASGGSTWCCTTSTWWWWWTTSTWWWWTSTTWWWCTTTSRWWCNSPDPKWHLRLNNLGKKPDRSWATPALCETSSASLGSIFPLESVVVFFLEKNHEFFHWIVLTFCKCGQLFRHHVLIWRFWR